MTLSLLAPPKKKRARPKSKPAPAPLRRVRARWLWTAATDNHVPTRGYVQGSAVEYVSDDDGLLIVVNDGGELRDAEHAVFLLDDGRSVRVAYVVGTSRSATQLHLRPVPVHDADFMLGPRRSFHLKMTPR